MKTKDEATTKVKQYILYVECQYDHLPKVVRADNGCKYTNKNLQQWFLDHGLEIQTTAS